MPGTRRTRDELLVYKDPDPLGRFQDMTTPRSDMPPLSPGTAETNGSIHNLGDQQLALRNGLDAVARLEQGLMDIQNPLQRPTGTPDEQRALFAKAFQQGGVTPNGSPSRPLFGDQPQPGMFDGLAMRLQNAHAIGQGTLPFWAQMQQHQQAMQMAPLELELKRQQAAKQINQIQEQKRGHDLQLLEKAMAHPKGSAMLEQLANDPNYSLASQAGMLSKAFKESDYNSFETYKQFIPEDVQQRFFEGKLPAHELTAWLDEARVNAKESAKANAKSAILSRAMNKPADQRSAYESQLVEEHQTAQDLKNADIELKKAHADKYRKDIETGGSEKLLGVDREAITQQYFGPKTRYSDLTTQQMGQVNNELLKFQGLQQLNKSTAVQQAQLQVPDKPQTTEREKSAEDLATLDALDNLKNLYSEDFVGPARGRAGAMMETFGGITEDEAKFRAANTALKNYVIKMITGAQMSEPEAKRILGQVPDPTNPPEVWKARLQETRKNIKRVAERRREVLSKTGVDTSSLPALSSRPHQQPDPVQSVLDEVLGQ